MIRSYTTPGSFKAALEDRLRNQATRDRADLQRLRQLMVFDRFLARLFLDDQRDVVLKGGLVLEMRTRRARATKDVDLRLMGRPDDALARLQGAGRADLGDFLTFEVGVDLRHPTIEADGLHYEGRRYRVEARLAGKIYARPFGVDVAFAEPIVGEPDTLHGIPTPGHPSRPRRTSGRATGVGSTIRRSRPAGWAGVDGSRNRDRRRPRVRRPDPRQRARRGVDPGRRLAMIAELRARRAPISRLRDRHSSPPPVYRG